MSDALLPLPKPKRESPGPVYQGVCAQIRRLTKPDVGEPLIDEKLWAGTIAQARSLAASIDRVDGRNGPQANGVPLGTMHGQLDALMARLNPEASDHDPIADLVSQFRAEEVAQRGNAPASHPQE